MSESVMIEKNFPMSIRWILAGVRQDAGAAAKPKKPRCVV
jgi:hypothetical protein